MIEEPTTLNRHPAQRSTALDRLRGLAITLMILDHVLVIFAPVSPVRTTVTRLAMPLFMVVSGLLMRLGGQYRRLRYLEAFAVVIVVTPLLGWLWPAFGVPEIVGVWLLVAITFRPVVQRWPLTGAVVGYIWYTYWPLAWHGYQPGVVLMFLCIGSLCVRDVGEIGRLGGYLPSQLERLGRRPLLIYGGHLLVLAPLAWWWAR